MNTTCSVCHVVSGRYEYRERLPIQLCTTHAAVDELVKALARLCAAKAPLEWSPTVELAEAFAHARAVLDPMRLKETP